MVSQQESAVYSEVNGTKYAKYTASTASSYLYIARVNNTVLYIDVDIEHKDEVEEFINEINY